ncbi:MAG: OmpA family protein [Bacteroidota bacterium]
MAKRLLLLLLIIHPFFSEAQKDCAFDAEGNCIGKGKTKTIKSKTTYGSTNITIVRDGEWVLFNTDGVKKASGSYESSMKNGEWQYFSDDNILLFKRWYNNGRVEKTAYLDSGYFAHESDTIIIIADSMGNFNIEERKGKINYHYSATPQQILKGDPSIFAIAEKKKAFDLERIHFTDAEIMQQYPNITLMVKARRWAVNTPLNLINNPDFEMERERMQPGHSSQIKPGGDTYAKFWGSANETPDIFYEDNNCYGGYRVFGVNYEVLRNELKQPLKEGVTYCLQFRLKLKKTNDVAINSVSVTLTDKPRPFKTPREAIDNGVVMQTHSLLPLACREQWMTVSGSFIANGGEKFLYIGNFAKDTSIRLTYLDNVVNKFIEEIYYYIDDVVLIEQKEGTICPCTVSGCMLDNNTMTDTMTIPVKENSIYTSPKVGQKLVLRSIQFETNKSELLPTSTEILDSIADLMLNYPAMKVEISGHTDNKGSVKANETLSNSRAYAVVMYLMELGIDESRMTYRGAGQTEPIDTNDTEEGRLNNRRVEFKITEM